MKKLIALLMASTLFLTACNSGMKNEDSNKNDSKIVEDATSIDDIDLDINPKTFSDLSDEKLLQYVEDEVYAGITEQLASEDYITITNNKIKLTEKGHVEAYRMYERHNMIAKIFMELGVDEKTAYHDSCMIEHDLSDVTFEAIKKAYHKYLELRKDS